jgi:hypothetical protein
MSGCSRITQGWRWKRISGEADQMFSGDNDGNHFEENTMAVNLDGLAGAVGGAENAASSAVNGLGPNSTAAQLTQVSLKMNQYQIVATAVSAIIKADSEAKSAPARAISR